MNTLHLTPLGNVAHSFADWLASIFAAKQTTAEAPRHSASKQILGKGEVFAVANPLAQRVECLEGSLWITHDGDCKDLVLEAGMNYQSQRTSRMLVYGLTNAAFKVQVAEQAAQA